MANLYKTNQYVSTTLATAGGIDDSQTTDIELKSVTGIDTAEPGICCISYSDPIDTDNAEWVTYTSIDSVTKKLAGVTRGAEGFSAKLHAYGVTIAFPLSESHINNLVDALSIGGDSTDGVTSTIDDDSMATASDTTLATSESIKAYVDNGTWFDGWIPVSETWTRTGNHTFTVTGDLTTKYRKGTKVRYKDGGAYEYGTVISSAYADPNTTVTLATNTDYTMAAATITDTYISYVENPEGFPVYFSWTPTIGGFSSDPTGTYKFKISSNRVQLFITQTAAGTSNANTFTISLPVTAANVAANFLFGVGIRAYRNNSTNVAGGGALITNSGTTIALQPVSLSSSGWATSNEKQIFELQMSYLF